MHRKPQEFNALMKSKKNIFIWDMPGLGGNSKIGIKWSYSDISGLQESNEKQWDDYLIKYGTGHFDKTFLLCDATEGINQMELFFLRHLLHNQR